VRPLIALLNDVIWEFERREIYDPSAGLGLIQARLLAVNFADDELNPVELGGERVVKSGHAITVPVGPNSRGHWGLAGLCPVTGT
jgi:homoserine O-acetyltransferase/O-succinyltransferase